MSAEMHENDLAEPLEVAEIRIKLYREISARCHELPPPLWPKGVELIKLHRDYGLGHAPVWLFQKVLDELDAALLEHRAVDAAE